MPESSTSTSSSSSSSTTPPSSSSGIPSSSSSLSSSSSSSSIPSQSSSTSSVSSSSESSTSSLSSQQSSSSSGISSSSSSSLSSSSSGSSESSITPGIPPCCCCGDDYPCDGETNDPCCESRSESDAGGKGKPGETKNPIRYWNGQILLSERDLEFNILGRPWGQTRVFDNIYGNFFQSTAGAGWYAIQVPRIYTNLDQTELVLAGNPERPIWFDRVSTYVYRARFRVPYTLLHEPAFSQLVLTDRKGQQLLFHDFETGTPLELRGRFKGIRNQAQAVALVEYVPTTTRILSIAVLENSVLTGFFYTWNGNKLASVTLRVKGVDVRRVRYTYYGAGSSHGREGDLQSAVREQSGSAGWEMLTECWYRYYTENSSTGYAGGLRYRLGPEAVRRLRLDGYDPNTALNSIVANYADNYFEYDEDRRVTKEIVGGGAFEHTFVYDSNPSTPVDVEMWSVRTTHTLPDGTENIVYTNKWGQVVFRRFKSGTDEWWRAFVIDQHSRITAIAEPSAIESYNESSTEAIFTLYTGQGLINYWVYGDQNGISGAPLSLLTEQGVKNGSEADEIPIRSWTYTGRTVGSITAWVLASTTEYQTDSGGGSPATTSFTYDAWYTDTFQPQVITTTLPVITTAQNGSNAANTRGDYYDQYGRVTWMKDERGFLTAYVVDDITGGLSRRIDDVDTSILTCPAGWTTPTGGGLHLITDFEFDSLGRQTQSLGPIHASDLHGVSTEIRRAEWTVYLDTLHEERHASGYATGTQPNYTYTLFNPIEIIRRDHANRFIEGITAIRVPDGGSSTGEECACCCGDNLESPGRLSNMEGYSLPQSEWARWQKMDFALSGLLSSQRTYFDIPTTGSGTSGVNYATTSFIYDERGRRIGSVTPEGTITRLVLGPRGEQFSTWVGTDDTGATPSDPTGGGATGNNMKMIAAREYDGGTDQGDFLLTEITLYAADSDTRVTSFEYDWRDRRTAAHGEEDFHEFLTYDNLDRVTVTERREGYSPTSILLAKGEALFDNLGRVYETLRYSVAAGTAGNALRTRTWFDAAGNVVKQRGEEGLGWQKFEFDSVGRMSRKAVACDPEDPDNQTYAQSLTLDDDVVLEQTDFEFDSASNPILQVVRERNHDTTGTGPLQGPSATQAAARVLSTCFWADPIGRQVAQAFYGTNGGAEVIRPSLIPDSTDTCLVTRTRFNARAETCETIDPAGQVRRGVFDDAGRLIKTIENYQSCVE